MIGVTPGAAGASGAVPTVVTNVNGGSAVVTGELVTFSATVSGLSGTPTGTVAFVSQSDNVTMCTATLNSGNGSCQGYLDGEVYTDNGYAAVYSGDSIYSSVIQEGFPSTSPAVTSVSISSAEDPGPPQTWIGITATVTPQAPSTATPTGSVSFTDSDGAISGQLPCEGGFQVPLINGMATCYLYVTGAQAQPVYAWYNAGAGYRSPSYPHGAVGLLQIFQADPQSSYWVINAPGQVFSYGKGMNLFGSPAPLSGIHQIVGAASGPFGLGYWLVASDGGIFAYGDAAFYGSTGGIHLNQPIVGMAATPDGGGYWLVASDGGIFAYGDAAFYGSTGAIHLNQPIVGMTPTGDGEGYWFVARDGGIFAYGDATYSGNPGPAILGGPVVAIAGST
jgi:hypothetical protein